MIKLPDSFVWNTVNVDLGPRSYEILIGPGVLSEAVEHLKRSVDAQDFFIITDSNINELIGIDLQNMLSDAGLSCKTLVFPAGEASKTIETVEGLCRGLVKSGADRSSCIIALGGGVTGDIAGFTASIYMRGIPFVQVPTSLLAQVDSSVGGKTGVDLPEGKNLVGTFYQPRLVICDIGVLATLPEKELKNGMAEVIKYGAIWDQAFFHYLEANAQACLELVPEVVAHIVTRSCEIKAEVVSRDEREGDLRRILNFGHTIGHAVEAVSRFEISHGEAVAMGMVAEARISSMLGLMDHEGVDMLTSLIDAFGLPTEIPKTLAREEILLSIKRDKKVKRGRVHFVLLNSIGKTKITDEVPEEAIEKALRK